MRCCRGIFALSLLSGIVTSGLAAQSAAARVLIGAGTATDLRGVRSGAYAVAPSLSLTPDPDFGLSLGGRGTRFTNGEWSLGGLATMAWRVPIAAGFGLLLSGNGEAIRTSYRATYLSGEGLPALEWRSGAVSLWGGVHGAAARILFRSFEPTGPLPLGSRSTSTTRSLFGPAFGGALRLAGLESGSHLSVNYREEHDNPQGVSVIDRMAGLSLSGGSLTLAGSVGFRNASDEHRTFGSARISVAVTSGIALIAAAERYPSNRLTATPGGRAFTVGVVLGVGGSRGIQAQPKPAGVPAAEAPLTRLSLAAPDAAEVDVAGDWNDWRPVPLRKTANGVWYVDLSIPRGLYRYAFRVDGKSWQVPKGVAAVDDGFGGKSAWLTVGDSGRTARQSANRKEAP
ncbi:MAG TPA: glycogen-binding domain-containing protein [Gemmatimonadales bacterium]|nr:glycogen-binding domain-containing protein [Gemmatimonadales bacterium]